MMLLLIGTLTAAVCIVLLNGINFIDPTERGIVERFGKYNRFANQGFQYVIPLIENLRRVNVTEQMVDAEPQDIITLDNLNARVDAQVYFRVKPDEDSVVKSQYNVDNYHIQITALARTTLRDIIGTMKFTEVNSQRSKLNANLGKELDKETDAWGIAVVRTELKEIEPPTHVQESMNKVIIAEKAKEAAVDFATAKETEADGVRRAAIKTADGDKQAAILRAEGNKQARILNAEGEARYIKDVNEAADKYFKGQAVELKKLETVAISLKDNAKIVVPSEGELVNVIGDLGGVTPIGSGGNRRLHSKQFKQMEQEER